jgi:hypothetical protein
METISVRCNHCGAPLHVGDSTRFVTCQFCKSSLEVKRTDSSVFTEEVAKIAENTGKMAGSLEVIELQNEIERLDREFGSAQLNAHKAGPVQKVTVGAMGAGMGIVFVTFGLFFAIGSSSMGVGGFGSDCRHLQHHGWRSLAGSQTP